MTETSNHGSGAADRPQDPVETGHHAQRPLEAELAVLRARLRTLRLPSGREQELRAAFRAHHRAQARPLWRRRLVVSAIAASVAVGAAVGGLAVVLMGPGRERPGSPPRIDAGWTAAAPMFTFQPLPYAPDISPSASYSVIRVRLPLSVLPPGTGTELTGTIEADVLLGVDGVATGIRFDRSSAVLMAASSQDGGVE